MSGAWFPPNMMPGIQAKEFNLCLTRPDNCFSWSESFRCILANSRRAAMCLLLRSGFSLATLPYWPDWWIAAEMVILLEGSPLFTEERWSSDRVTIGFLVTSLTKAHLPRSLSLDGRPALGRVLVVPYFFHLQMMEATVLIGTFKAAEHFLYPPDLFLKTIPLTSCLVCALTCTVNCGTFYTCVCLSKSCPIN